MVATMNWLLVLAAESHGIPGDDWRAQIAVPLGVVLFIGSVYMLVRANLGTRRGYLVSATSLFGFMIIYSLFWTFGAPGTPPATGPQNLPGQELDAYEDTWRPFAGDSNIANQPEYAVAKTYPEGFSDTPEAAGLEANIAEEAETGTDDIQTFFSTTANDDPTAALQKAVVGPTWAELEEERRYAQATNGRPIVAATFQQTWQVGKLPPGEVLEEGESPPLTPDGATVADDRSNVAPEGTEIGDLVEDGDTYTAFAFFDQSDARFPSYVTTAIMLILFIIHALLLAADERRERRERTALATETVTEERVPAGATRL